MEKSQVKSRKNFNSYSLIRPINLILPDKNKNRGLQPRVKLDFGQFTRKFYYNVWLALLTDHNLSTSVNLFKDHNKVLPMRIVKILTSSELMGSILGL